MISRDRLRDSWDRQGIRSPVLETEKWTRFPDCKEQPLRSRRAARRDVQQKVSLSKGKQKVGLSKEPADPRKE